ncbi:hypothetical protein D3C76_1695150 [compost metagenome]
MRVNSVFSASTSGRTSLGTWCAFSGVASSGARWRRLAATSRNGLSSRPTIRAISNIRIGNVTSQGSNCPITNPNAISCR